MIILLATKNEHKIKEIKEILTTTVDFKVLGDYVNIEIQETGRTLTENSLFKAAFAFKVSNIPSLADDSGLFVEALDGEPGIYSSRYGKDDRERIARVLKNLESTKNRRATFKAVFVYYYAPNRYEAFKGECRGNIATEPRGNHGFGYDPIFIPKGYKRTFAELGQEVKNRISHRLKALTKFKNYLETLPK